MATGIFTLRNQLLGLIQKAWTQPPTYAGVFNGTNQYINTPTSTNLNLGTSSFTLEYWINTTSYTSAIVPVSGGGSATTYDPQFGYGHAPMLVYLSSTGSSWDIASGQTIGTTVLNQWYHVAIVRSGSTFYTFLNGVQGATFTSSASIYQSTNAFLIGQGQGTQFVNGQVSNVRFVKGTALYTANFTPPTSPLTAVSGTQLLTLQNPTIIDNSANAFTLTNNNATTTQQAFPFTSSAYATPAVEYLVVAGGGGGGGGVGGGGGAGGLLQGLLPVTSGNSYTVTVGSGGTNSTNYTSGSSGTNSIFSSITAIGGGFGGGYSPGSNGGSGGSGGGGGSYSGIWIGGAGTGGQGNSGGAGAGSSAGYAGGGGGAGTIGRNAYYSGTNDTSSYGGAGGAGIASAISGTVTAYAGGGGGASGVNGYNTGAGALGGVGGGGVGGSDTSPGSAGGNGTANTGGGGGGSRDTLVSGSGGSGIVIISYPDTYNAPTTLTGTYTASTSGSGSLYFGGSSNIYSSSWNSAGVFGTSDFTVECWVYATSAPGSNQVIWAANAYPSTTGLYVSYYGGASTDIKVNAGASNLITASGGWSFNAWHHIAVTRSSGTLTLWIDGLSKGSTTFTTNCSDGMQYIGRPYDTAGYYFNGYLTNFRITKSASLYTSTFTPSTFPLTTTVLSGTVSLLLNSVSGASLTDNSTNGYYPTNSNTPTWNQASPFATGLGYKNRVYTWTASGTVTF